MNEFHVYNVKGSPRSDIFGDEELVHPLRIPDFSIGYRAEKSTESMDMIDLHQFRLRTILIEKCMVTATSKTFWRFCIKAAPRKCLVLIFMLYK